jgi:hypothetical protein
VPIPGMVHKFAGSAQPSGEVPSMRGRAARDLTLLTLEQSVQIAILIRATGMECPRNRRKADDSWCNGSRCKARAQQQEHCDGEFSFREDSRPDT